MEKKFFIIIGRSGSGKGTQADLLKAYLEKKGTDLVSPENSVGQGKVLHITTGGNFRKFTLGESFAAKKAFTLASEGSLLPEFLGIWNWSNIFIETLEGNETVILDGAPRRMAEVEALHSALKFYEYDHATVIYLDVSATWALDKLANRKREDDTKSEFAEKKMEWFETDVLPVLDMYSRDPRFTYVHVNGEQTVEEVHEELLDKVFSLD